MTDPHSSPGSDRLRFLWLFSFMITLLALSGVVAAAAPAGSASGTAPAASPAEGLGLFTNPLLRPPAQDPQVTYHAGNYYYCESSHEGVFLRVATEFAGLSSAAPRRVWAPPATGPFSKNIWAPELHILDGRAHIYVAADDGDNANHRMGVLVAETDDILGPYRLASILDTQGWAIDGTVLTLDDGRRYFIWSGWPGKKDGQQNLYIARMKSPTELVGRRVLLKRPDQPWERHAMPICEGPQVLRRDGRTFLIYSASGSWTAEYCLGMLVLEPGADPMVAANWTLAGQVFARNEHALGVGHCGFILSEEGGAGDWLVYHAKTLEADGWGDREVRAQPFRWDVKGWPIFGEPVDPALPLVLPDVPTEFLADARRARARTGGAVLEVTPREAGAERPL
jgi:GH43 family beta-xylosidase